MKHVGDLHILWMHVDGSPRTLAARVLQPHASTEYADLQHASSPTCYSHKWPSESVKFDNTRRAEKKTRRPRQEQQRKGGRSSTSSDLQGCLLSVLAHCPTTADSAQFCLLCYQPEPIPRTLAARMLQFTLEHPCRLSAW